jgi:hypothetical protein
MHERAWSAEQCAGLLPKAKKTPSGWKACCPAHEDSDPSLFLADGEDGVALVCYAGCDYKAVAAALESRGAVLNAHSSHDQSQIPSEHFQLGPYHASWDYRDAGGRVIMRVCRWEQDRGKKDIRPLWRSPLDGWKWSHHPTPRPLYQLDRLANDPQLPVLMVEGEKTATAAQKLFPGYIVTTWPGGAAAMGQANIEPLRGRDVVLVPDCDVPGRKAMSWWTQHLRGHAKSVRTVDPGRFVSDLPEGWDLADALTEHRDVSAWLIAPPAPEVRTVAAVRFQSLQQVLDAPNAGRDWFFTEIMPAGCFLVVGRPKVGKSWFLLQLALTAASGGKFLGFDALGVFQVLYIASEDDATRIKSRFQRYRTTESPSGLQFMLRDDLDNLSKAYSEDFSFAEFLDQYLEAHPEVQIVIVDTESTVRAVWDGNRRPSTETSITRKDYSEVREFDQIAIRRHAFIALVNHTAKRKTAGWIDIHELINRTNTASAGASGSFVISDPPGSDPYETENTVRVLGIRGRDIKGEHLIAIQQDALGVFQSLGPYKVQRQSAAETEVLEALEEMMQDALPAAWHTAAQIAGWLGKNKGAVQRTVSRMIRGGKRTWKDYRIETQPRSGVRLSALKSDE